MLYFLDLMFRKCLTSMTIFFIIIYVHHEQKRAFSSVGQSNRLITGWSGVRIPEGPPKKRLHKCNLFLCILLLLLFFVFYFSIFSYPTYITNIVYAIYFSISTITSYKLNKHMSQIENKKLNRRASNMLI